MPERKRPQKGSYSPTEVGAILEDLRSQFRTFGEGLEDVRGRIAGIEAEVREFRDFSSFHRLTAENMRQNLESLTAMGRKITADIAAIHDDFKRLETRLATVEAKVGI